MTTPPVIVGTGRLTLDVLVRAGEPRAAARSQAGGTCGNVLANLAWLGWHAYPLADLGDDDPGRRFSRDLARFGVRLDLVRRFADQETPVILHHLRDTPAGPEHRFSSRCPYCGGTLQYYEPVPDDRVRDRLPQVPPASVCFFDRDSPGALRLAAHCRAEGAVVVYEPNYAGPESDLAGALAVADVLKFSREKLPGLAESRDLTGPTLVIETRGADGLRYRDRDAAWRHLPAIRVPVVRDAGGAGDWCTAGFLHVWTAGGEIAEALRFGQALGAWNCAFEGARGGMYVVERDRALADVQRLIAGDEFDPNPGSASTQDDAGAFCPRCPPG